MENKVVLITGASGGIGYELAKIFAKNRFDLVLIARSELALDKVKNDLVKEFEVDVKVKKKDLTDLQAPDQIYSELKKDDINIDILVNNAGFGDMCVFAESDLNKQLDMIQLNIMSLTHLTRLFLEDMVKQRNGKILNVASTAAFQPGPFMSVYYATKAFVLSFSTALSEELAGTNVSVTTLCPGPTNTAFSKVANFDESKFGTEMMSLMSAKQVAEIGYKGLMRKRSVIIPGFRNWFLAFSTRFIPDWIILKMVRKVHGR